MIKVTRKESEPVLQPPPTYRISSTEGQGQYVLSEQEAWELYKKLRVFFEKDS